MHSNVWCDKILCDMCLTRIIGINKSHAEICRFTVIHSPVIPVVVVTSESIMEEEVLFSMNAVKVPLLAVTLKQYISAESSKSSTTLAMLV